MKTRLALMFLALALAACQQMPAKQPVTSSPIALGPNEWRVTETVLIVTDASLSMYKERAFPDAKALSQAIAASLPSDQAAAEREGPYRAGTLGFGGRERQGAPIAPLDAAALAQATSELNILGSLTPLDRVLDEAARSIGGLGHAGRVAVIVVTDGSPDDEARTLAAGRRLVESSPGGVCLHTIQVGDEITVTGYRARDNSLRGAVITVTLSTGEQLFGAQDPA